MNSPVATQTRRTPKLQTVRKRTPEPKKDKSSINLKKIHAITDVQAAIENQLLCKKGTTRKAFENMMRRTGLIKGKGEFKSDFASTTYLTPKSFKVLGLPVASVSFVGNDDSSESAFWINLAAAPKEVVAAVHAKNIPLTKYKESENTFVSTEKNNQRVEVSAISGETETVVSCYLVKIN